MPIVDDVLTGLQIQIDTLWYNLLMSVAGMHWSVQRAFLMMGYTLELITQWLATNAFAPLIAQTNASLQVAVSGAFFIALIVLGITYLLAAFARLRIVDPKSAVAWYLAGALFFSLAPQIYVGMNDFRHDVASAFYASSLSGLQGTTGSAFDSLDGVTTSDLGLIRLCDNFGSYMPVWNATIDGLDVALAYLRADAIDILGYPSVPRDPACQPHTPDPVTGLWSAGTLPWEWRRPGSFFANDRDPAFFPTMTALERAASLDLASAAHGRLLTAWPLILFGAAEQLVTLLLTIAQGLTFVSFGIAILFAFFRKTEVIARSIIDLWIELIVQTVVIALIQALVVTFFLVGSRSANAVVVLGVGLICLIFMVIVLFSGVKAVWNAFNRLFNAFGQATGGAVVSPGTAAAITAATAVGTAGLAIGAGSGAISLGSNALAGMTALQSGATPAQAAGLTFGGVQPIANASRTLAYLPGVRGTALGEAAEQFTEGAVTRRVARDVPLYGRVAGPMVGAMLLTNRDPEADHDESGRSMLVPAVGQGLAGWTTPRGKRPARRRNAYDETWLEDDDGEFFIGTSDKPKRMGTFTPVTRADSDRAAYADDMRGEEMEQHLSDVMRGGVSNRSDAAAARLERSADALERAGGTLTGSLRIQGSADVASVMGDVLRLLGDRGASGVDHLTTARLMAQAVGITPQDDSPAVRGDLTRFGLFADSAARSGLSPEIAERVSREVHETPDRHLSENLRLELVDHAVGQGRSRQDAEREVQRLEIAARLLPESFTAFGALNVDAAPQKQGDTR